jgi:hypothetical protein
MNQLSPAPVPPEPLPWDNNDYEDNVDTDNDSDDETLSERSYSTFEGYESEDSVKTSWTFNLKLRKSKTTEPVPYYKSILQEEEYFSE